MTGKILLGCAAALALAASGPLLATVDDATPKPAAKKRGGFTGPTPRPKEVEAGEATPRPHKRPKPRADSDPSETRSESVTESEGTGGAATSGKSKKRAPANESKAADKDSASSTETIPAQTHDQEGNDNSSTGSERAPVASLDPSELSEFSAQPPRVQALIAAALSLTKLNLSYKFGSADPSQGGMDCSGTIHHLLRAQGFAEVPRDSSEQYMWARKNGEFFAVVGKKADSFEFQELAPGDLLFWSGTYQVARDFPISHVMLYLGREKKSGKRVMFGASDGRTYNGVQRWGVSVFDFVMPRVDIGPSDKPRVDFVGFARIPRLREAKAALTSAEPATPEASSASKAIENESESNESAAPRMSSQPQSKSKTKPAAAAKGASKKNRKKSD